jgi:hypothetical protein
MIAIVFSIISSTNNMNCKRREKEKERKKEKEREEDERTKTKYRENSKWIVVHRLKFCQRSE